MACLSRMVQRSCAVIGAADDRFDTVAHAAFVSSSSYGLIEGELMPSMRSILMLHSPVLVATLCSMMDPYNAGTPAHKPVLGVAE
jgi:hypothetical protein